MGDTHKQLCALAVKWLQRPASRSGPGCLVAVSESSNWLSGEIPDAIGWRPYQYGITGSVVVEVKVNRADFLADASKPHRLEAERGMGAYRYFFAPEGLIRIEELPAKWGLVEVNVRGHLKVRAGHVLLTYQESDTWRHGTFNEAAEIGVLSQCLNRVGDPQKVQDMLREANNRNARLLAQNERLEKHIRTLEGKLRELRDGGEAQEPVKPIPRRPFIPPQLPEAM